MDKDYNTIKNAKDSDLEGRSENCDDELLFCDVTSEYGSLKNELMQAMYRFKSVGRRNRNFRFGHMHKHDHHHGHDPHERGDFHNDFHGLNDINPGEMFFLKHIIARKSSGDSSGNWLSSISDVLHISKAAVSQMLSSLEKKGFVTRETNPENRREIIVRATKEGEKRVNEIQQLFDEQTDTLIERFGVDDTKELIRLINKLANIIGEEKE